MHLHQLKIKNLASLRGEHSVEFDQLAGQDLFAITGETGAGKSTLLNAISLALYGKLYKRQLIQSDLVTLGEREASIALLFSVKGEAYLATWSTVVRKKDGTLLGTPRTERFFYQLPADRTLAEARVLEQAPEHILQLDFEQFCKCVVLNQGEFARFLTASFADRKEILERLYPSDNIDSIGGLAKHYFEDKRGLMSHLEVQAHALQEESLFDVTTVQTNLERHQQEVKRWELELARLRPVNTILANLIGQTKLLESAERTRHSSAEQLKLVTEANNLAMSTWQAQQEKLTSFQQLWDQQRPQIELDLAQYQELTVWQAQAQGLEEQIKDKERQRHQQSARLEALNGRIRTIQAQLTALSTAARLVAPERAWDQIDLVHGSELFRREGLQRQLTEQARQGLQQTESEGRSLSEKLAASAAQITEQQSALPSALRELEHSERSSLLQKLRAQEAERALVSETLQGLEKTREKLALQLHELEAKAQQSQWLSTLLELRQELVKKHPAGPEACPICEQQVTPALWHKLTRDWDHARASEQTAGAVELNRALEELRTELAATQQQASHARARLAQLPEKIQLAQIEHTHDTLIRLAEAHRELTERLAQCRERWKRESDLLERSAREAATLAGDLSHWQQVTAQKLGFSTEWSLAVLSDLQHDQDCYRRWRELQRETEALKAQENELQKDLRELVPVLEELRGKQQQLSGLISARRHQLKERYPDSSPAERLRERNEELKALVQKDQWLQNEFRKKERELGDVRARLSAVQDQIKQIELLYTQECEKLTPYLPAPLVIPITEAALLLAPLHQDNEAGLVHAEEQLKGHTEKIAELRTLLEKDRQLREKRALLQEQHGKLAIEVARYKRLMDVLGQEDLRTYVLSLVEAALIQQTNHELQKLCAGRYEIQHSVRKGKLAPEFWVIDRWRDGLLRKVTTLSGGETFMVSLAMALALAEMTRGKADIDCFFIDEGFGTLDEDSLEGVLEMLQQVQSRGKQIGLITHVKALSTRLPLNLNLQKDPRGNSTVGVVWN